MRMATVSIALVSLFGLAAGNFVSPKLGKCMDIKAELKDDKTRETVEDMKKHETPINVQLYKCHGKHNQKFEVKNGSIVSLSLGWCLKAVGTGNEANVQLEKCDETAKQNWDLTAFGYVKSSATGKCLDVFAVKKADGSRESFDEIKARTTVNVQLFDCHDPETTKRVNQLYEWAPVTGNGKLISAFQLRHLGFLKSSNLGHGMPTLALAGVASLAAAGLFVGLRMRRVSTSETSELLSGEE